MPSFKENLERFKKKYPDKEIALTGLDVNNPYQLVFNDHQINTEIEGYTLSKIVDANDAQKEYPLTTIEQGYVDITLPQNITKLHLVYTKNPEPVQQPDNSQTETDNQQPSDEQEESSEEESFIRLNKALTLAVSTLGEKGLVTNSSAPYPKPVIISSSSSRAETIITGELLFFLN